MKNKVLALVTGLSSLVLLAACSNQQNGLTSTTSSSSVEQSQSSSSESSSQEKKVDTSAYDSIISKYQTAVANNQTDDSLNFLVVNYANSQTSPASTVYTYRDLDGNGVDELVLAFKPGRLFKEHVITDIYTISKDSGQVIRLTEGPQLGMLGAFLFQVHSSTGIKMDVSTITDAALIFCMSRDTNQWLNRCWSM